jgi:hypothetical protein
MAAAFVASVGCSKLDSQTQLNSRTKSSKTAAGTTVQADDESSTRGTSIFIPPSATGVDGDQFQIENGPARIANQTTAAYLTIPGSVVAAGEPVAITYGDSLIHEQAGSLILSLPIEQKSGFALRRPQADVVVFYEVFTASDKITTVGLVPNSDLTLDEDKISLKLRGFGTYQLGYLSIPVLSEISKANDGKTIPLNNLSSIRRALNADKGAKSITSTTLESETSAAGSSNSNGTTGENLTGSTSTDGANGGTTTSGTSSSGSTSSGSGTSGNGTSSSGGSGSSGTWNMGWTELTPSAFETENSPSHVSVGVSQNGTFVAVAAKRGSTSNFIVARFANGQTDPVYFNFGLTIFEAAIVVASQVSVDDNGTVVLALLLGSDLTNGSSSQLRFFAASDPAEILTGSNNDIEISTDPNAHYLLEMQSHSNRGIINITSSTIGGMTPEHCGVVAFQLNASAALIETRKLANLIGANQTGSQTFCGAKSARFGAQIQFLTPVLRGEFISIDQASVDLNAAIDSINFVPVGAINIALPDVSNGGPSSPLSLMNGLIRITPAADGNHLSTISHQDDRSGPVFKSSIDPTYFNSQKVASYIGDFIALELSQQAIKSPLTGISCTADCGLIFDHETNLPSFETGRLPSDLFAYILPSGPMVIDRVLASATERNAVRAWSSWQQAETNSNLQFNSSQMAYSSANLFALTRLQQVSGSTTRWVQLLVYVK